MTKAAPTPAQQEDLLFAWRVAKFVKSNAIVFCGGGRTLGVGAGQMSRVDSARIAAIKAQNAGLVLSGSVVASDAFFPFRDGLDVVADAGAIAVIQPGGSLRDQEVISAADERGIAMVFTAHPSFRTSADSRVKLLVIGGGGREHALAWKLARSPRVSKVMSPGQCGYGRRGGCRKRSPDRSCRNSSGSPATSRSR